MTDRVVYETQDKPTYVTQFKTENGDWVDTYPPHRSKDAAVRALNEKTATPYPFRIVERTK